MTKVFAYGFAESPTANQAAAEAFADAGACVKAWMLHENWIRSRGLLMDGRDCEVVSESPPPDVGRRILRPLSFPDWSAGDEANLRYLADRERHFDHEWQKSLFIQQRMLHVESAIERSGATAVVFGVLPHSLTSYLLYLYARSRGLPTAIIRYGPSPFQFGYVDAIDRVWIDHLRMSSRTGRPPEPSDASQRYVAKLTGSYDQAMPGYVRDRLGRGALARRAVRRIRQVDRRKAMQTAVGMARRHRLRRVYERLALPTMSSVPPEAHVISVFLHMQPERSTTPEGGRFAQQWLIVQSLASQVSNDWVILVREHPMTFRASSRIVRDEEFYGALMSLPQVKLISSEVSPYDLLARSHAVATVTGAIGLEALANGRSVLAFGNATYLGCQGVKSVGVGESIPLPSEPGSADHLLDFLAEVDNSDRVWTAPWGTGPDVGSELSSGRPFRRLIPRIMQELS